MEDTYGICLSFDTHMTFLAAQKFSAFDWRKAIAATSYLAEKTGDTLYIVMKMMYLADKAHLDRYGRFIAGDWYVAMEKGPVPSETYKLLSALRDGEAADNTEGAAKQIKVLKDQSIVSIGRENYDELSDSDIECLDAIIETYRRVGKWSVKDMSHDEVWEKSWAHKGLFSKRAPMPMDKIAEHVGGAELAAHVRDPQPGSA